MKWSLLLTPIPCAVLFCLANAFKPAVIDDLAYIWYARQIVETPAEPFGPPPDGFRLIWYQYAQSSFTLLTPMVVPYWLAVCIDLFGENLVLLKLWLFPFCLLFTSSLYSLLRRFGAGLEKPLLVLTAFSPTFLPSLNVMVDIPALALSLTAITVFIRALDGPKPRWRLVVIAGILAGLAAQTKYTGTTSVAVMLLYGVARRQRLAAVTAMLLAVSIFVGWEAYLTKVYGRSHFLMQVDMRRAKPRAEQPENAADRVGSEIVATLEKKLGITTPLFGNLGGLGMPLIPFLLFGLRARFGFVHYFTAVILAGFLLTACIPERWSIFYRDPENERAVVSIGTLLMGMMGVCVALLLGAGCIAVRSAKLEGSQVDRITPPNWFLIGWLVVELLAYYALTPFAAARRLVAIIVVSTLIIGRLLASGSNVAEYQRGFARYVAFGVSLGIVYAWTDYRDARAQRDALFTSIGFIEEQAGARPRIWFAGHWGFQYYGERAGLETIYPAMSVIEEGDWLIVPDGTRPHSQTVRLAMPFAERRGTIEIGDDWPLNTIPLYYDGYMPIRRHDGPRIRIAIYRANQRFVALSK